jgi:hypothetical protein
MTAQAQDQTLWLRNEGLRRAGLRPGMRLAGGG